MTVIKFAVSSAQQVSPSVENITSKKDSTLIWARRAHFLNTFDLFFNSNLKLSIRLTNNITDVKPNVFGILKEWYL